MGALQTIAKIERLKKLKAQRLAMVEEVRANSDAPVVIVQDPIEQLPEWALPLLEPKRYKCLYGGRGSGKSYAAADCLLIEGKRRKCRVLCAREFQNSLEESVHQLLSDRIEAHGYDDFYRITQNKITGKNGTVFLFKGVHSNTQSIKSLQGLTHLWIEEAQAISSSSWRVLTPTVRNEGSEVWITMNPENESDVIYFEFIKNRQENSWVERVNWDRNPHFTSVLDEERLRMKSLYPEDVYKHIWEGEIKKESDAWQVIPTAWVDAAMKRWEEFRQPVGAMTALGVDVARGGRDKTIFAPRYGPWFDELIRFPGSATPNGPMVAAKVVETLGNESAEILVDVLGVGSSVYDSLEGSYPVFAVGSGEAAQDSWGSRFTDATGNLEFVNIRSWMWWAFREMLNPETSQICLPPDDELKQDLTAPRWSLKPPIASSDSKGRIFVESKYDSGNKKDGLKSRLGRSPDSGDAVVYASIDTNLFDGPEAGIGYYTR